jgi:hypothetical protein
VRFFLSGDFDKTAMSAGGAGQHAMLEQKPGELFDAFINRAAAAALAKQCRVVWLENMCVADHMAAVAIALEAWIHDNLP